jgi:hypothetical protein
MPAALFKSKLPTMLKYPPTRFLVVKLFASVSLVAVFEIHTPAEGPILHRLWALTKVLRHMLMKNKKDLFCIFYKINAKVSKMLHSSKIKIKITRIFVK